MLAVSIMSAGQNVYAAELPYETPDEIAEEEYWDSLELLALCVEAEAGNQTLEGKRLVAAVVLNRVASGSFANSISGVIYESGQFTPAMTGWLDQVVASGAPSDCYEAAQAALKDKQ